MALRDQPYLPLYIQDFLTDEKLIECSAAATGVYVRLMCILHKSNEYGKILLKQKDKQTDNQINNFCLKLARQLPYDFDTILAAITELLNENVLHIDGDFLCQKRMICDNELSLKRSKSGKKGGDANKNNNMNFAQAKLVANAENENEYNTVLEDTTIILPLMSKEDLEKFRLKLAGDQTFVEYLIGQRGVGSMSNLLSWADVFDIHILGEGKFHKDYSEYKRHFKNWVLKQDTFSAPPQTKASVKKMVV